MRLYSSQHGNIAIVAAQLRPNDRFRKCVLLYCCIECTAAEVWETFTDVMTVATECAKNDAAVALCA